MRTRISSKEHVVLPAAIRRKLGLRPGDFLDASVKSGRQSTDGHQPELAKARDSVLATLDERIPAAFGIPG